MKLNADLGERALVHSDELEWVASPMAGVERRMLERDGDEVARATSLVRYAPGSAFHPHAHRGGEEFLVLEGVFADDSGEFAAGMYVRNPVGSQHAPSSLEGCRIFVKLWQMPATDQCYVRVDTTDEALWQELPTGIRQLPLHHSNDESVALVELPAGHRGAPSGYVDGAELFVLTGTLDDGKTRLRAGSWLRLPAGEQHTISSTDGARYYVKTGHLRRPPPRLG